MKKPLSVTHVREPEGAPEDIDILDVAHDAFNTMAFVILQRGCGDAQKMWYNIEVEELWMLDDGHLGEKVRGLLDERFGLID